MKLEQNLEFIYDYRKDKEEYPDMSKLGFNDIDIICQHFYIKVSEKISHIITEENNHKSLHFIIQDVFINPRTFKVLVKVVIERL